MDRPPMKVLNKNPKILEKYNKWRGCEKKKSFSKAQAQEISDRKIKLEYYKCDYCPDYHLTKHNFKTPPQPSTKTKGSK